jgi:predicted HD phosphohydrolase
MEAARSRIGQHGQDAYTAEAEDFENDPWFGDYIQLRKWDEQAKDPLIPLPALRSFQPMLIHHFEKIFEPNRFGSIRFGYHCEK